MPRPTLAPTRRDILRLAAAAPAFALPALTRPARAELGPPAAANPAHFRFTLGEARVTIVSDGYFTVPAAGLGVNADPAEVQAFLTRHFLPADQSYNHTNHVLIDTGEAVILVDVGSGARFFDTAGRLLANLETAGYAAGDITHVVITHAHPDHLWGIRDDFDEPLFPEARYTIGGREKDYWEQPGLVDRVPPEAQQFVAGAVNSMAIEGVDWQLAAEGHQLAPGVTLIDTPGHTPGHMSLRIESGGQVLYALGDAMTHAWLNFARPDWYNGVDTDGPQTVATRRRLLETAAAERAAVVGYHFPFPGVGHVMAEGAAYRFVPALWQFD
ncbi:MBL fold metallo-hydrolase [Pseudooceanicola sp. 216_PA32_1]|uniref:MBL fold metallo-hydrolase n=1 Tax=Pseudooceanicola pacificus TaxID=2676438 RepID=A0A844W4V5_9RHOB|nr:MBL fold metallo-hydrolase [Pseudooceanicola pacificus]MWB77744.1 MBL fold metallo-hydrolase [Pseudooceanicola pacificus]